MQLVAHTIPREISISFEKKGSFLRLTQSLEEFA